MESRRSKQRTESAVRDQRPTRLRPGSACASRAPFGASPNSFFGDNAPWFTRNITRKRAKRNQEARKPGPRRNVQGTCGCREDWQSTTSPCIPGSTPNAFGVGSASLAEQASSFIVRRERAYPLLKVRAGWHPAPTGWQPVLPGQSAARSRTLSELRRPNNK